MQVERLRREGEGCVLAWIEYDQISRQGMQNTTVFPS